jgi:hypothetical protein
VTLQQRCDKERLRTPVVVVCGDVGGWAGGSSGRLPGGEEEEGGGDAASALRATVLGKGSAVDVRRVQEARRTAARTAPPVLPV